MDENCDCVVKDLTEFIVNLCVDVWTQRKERDKLKLRLINEGIEKKKQTRERWRRAARIRATD